MSIFDKISAAAFRAGIRSRTPESEEWFANKVKELAGAVPSRTKILKDDALEKQSKIRVGDMIMYFYDPKTKETLPYYDKFPLTIIVDKAPGGFYGLNLHYLHPRLRVGLLENLYAYSNDFDDESVADENVRLGLRYQSLATASNLRVAKPCVKQYLFEHLDSKIVKVNPSQWDFVPLLPLSKFTSEKGSINTNTVYRETREKII